jgi:protein TonB
VDEEGKSKSVEVYQSSGFALLDQAAVETVRKRWRFYPAREGEKRVENRIRIPIEFSLRNLKQN